MSDEERRAMERMVEAGDAPEEALRALVDRDAMTQDGLDAVRGVVTWLQGGSGVRWSAGTLLTEDDTIVTWRGVGLPPEGAAPADDAPEGETPAHRPPALGRYVEVRGRWEGVRTGMGARLAAEKVIVVAPTSPVGVALLLSTEARYKGIGKVKGWAVARELVARNLTLGDLVQRRNGEPSAAERLKSVAMACDVDPEQLARAAKDWDENARAFEQQANLYGIGLQANEVARAMAALQDPFRAVARDPYVLMDVVGLPFQRADEVALRLGTPSKDERRLAAGVRHAVARETLEGNCWTAVLPVSRVASEVTKTTDDVAAAEEVAMGFPEPDDQKRRRAQVVLVRQVLDAGRGIVPALAPRSLWAAEAGLWERLSSGRPNVHLKPIDEELARRIETDATDEQLEGLMAASRHAAIVVTGPAGTGKTRLVAAITRLYQRFGKIVRIVAPTGKAARRIQTVLRSRGSSVTASTVHRLLASGPMGTSEDAEVDADAVIVDEASMLDVQLAWRLVKAMKLGASLVLVGDHNQLPPVGAGALLRDLVASQACPVVKLNQVKRQAGVLRLNSLEVLQGRLPRTCQPNEDGSVDWIVDLDRPAVHDVVDAVVAYYRTWLHSRVRVTGIENHRLLREIQVITPQKAGPVGVEGLNGALRRMVHEVAYGHLLDEESAKSKFLPGDKVMQTRNNYDLGLMNGYQGTVTSMTRSMLVLESDDEDRAIEVPKAAWTDLELSYAASCHKMQGSEVDRVIAVCHGSIARPLKTRNLLYTAATRAARSVVFVGDRAGADDFLKNVQKNDRRTFLSEFARRARAGAGA